MGKKVTDKFARTENSNESEILSALDKITILQNKICQYLKLLMLEILNLCQLLLILNIFYREDISEAPELEDESELGKRQKRASEFTKRFARNNLYQIRRLVSSKRKLMKKFD